MATGAWCVQLRRLSLDEALRPFRNLGDSSVQAALIAGFIYSVGAVVDKTGVTVYPPFYFTYLLVMVMFSGYENFVSQLDVAEDTEKLSWLGKLDTSSLKNKVAASIVAISSIHLLKIFMNAVNIPDNKLMWYVLIHLTFVASAVAMGLLDAKTKHH